MSIWCTWPTVGNPSDRKRPNGTVRSYAQGWSNHYPDKKVEQPSTVEVASIPRWCVTGRDASWDEADAHSVGPWLRVSLYTWQHDAAVVVGPLDASVVMTEDAVEMLRDQLTEWLDRPKVHPPKTANSPATPTR